MSLFFLFLKKGETMKNNWLKYLALLAMFISGNVFCMPRPKSKAELEAKQKAFRRILNKEKAVEPAMELQPAEWPPQSGSKREHLEEAFISDPEYFIYEEGTHNGFWIDKDKAEKSIFIKNKVHDENNKIAVPVPANILKIAFEDNVEFNNFSLVELFNLIQAKQFLMMPEENIAPVITLYKNRLTNGSLDELTELILFIKNSIRLTKSKKNIIIGQIIAQIVEAYKDRLSIELLFERLVVLINAFPTSLDLIKIICGLLNEIYEVIITQYEVDIGVEPYPEDMSAYSTKKISVRPGGLYIIDYHVLRNLNEKSKQLLKMNCSLSGDILNNLVRYELTPWTTEREIREHFKNDDMVNFLDALAKRVQYNALPWYKKIFWYLNIKK
jgi:hypothetical protein